MTEIFKKISHLCQNLVERRWVGSVARKENLRRKEKKNELWRRFICL